MSLSRRRFLTNTTLSAAGIPLLATLGSDFCEASTENPIDWSMGFPGDAVLLNRNENPIGPSSAAIEAAKNGIARSFRYADPDSIRGLLAEHHSLEKDEILVGTGSGEILKIAPLVFARDGNVVATLESYRQCPAFSEKLGSSVKWVNLRKHKNYSYDVKGLIEAVDDKTGLLFAVTPNNPTGTILPYEDMKIIADSLPRHVLFVIDEAYVHFQKEGKSGIDLVKEGYNNVLVTRTFSKAYALAGLRCGYGIGHPDIMKKISNFGCGPTSTNMAGFGAAIASLADDAHLQRSRKFVSDTRKFYQTQFSRLGITTLSGPPIFIMAEFGDRTSEISAELRKQKIYVRDGKEWALPNHIRISYGYEQENQAFFRAIKKLI
ncbi:MAG: aminotransferase class I/II-fold pyridoxal phosphate-dependent enzyme [Gammaproteobacteria bacterium]|nr:aminotransferase class I/II-fold pyridoxal phosphate-dependent enzyme [Gammaproteobacteria bacterium]